MGTSTATPTPFEISEAGRRLRALVGEATGRGASMVSAVALQSRLFDVYDDVAPVEPALGVVQRQLTLTVGRTWFSASEVEGLADQVDWLLSADGTGSGPDDARVVSSDLHPEAGEGATSDSGGEQAPSA